MKRGHTTALLGILLAATVAGAAPKDDGEIPLAELSLEELLKVEVVTAGPDPLTVQEAPATVYVFSRELILRRGWTSLEDLLMAVPEVELQKKSTVEFWNNVTVRGISRQSKFIILKDGFRIDAAGGTPRSIGPNYSLMDAAKVEVMLGPASALYGADAFTGVINIISLSGEELDGAYVRGSYGSFGTTDNHLVAGKKFGEYSLRINGSFYSSNEPNLPSYYPEDFAWYFDEYLTRGKAWATPNSGETLLDVPIQPYTSPSRAYSAGALLEIGRFTLGFLQHGHQFSSSLGEGPERSLYVPEAKWSYNLQTLYAQHLHTSRDGRFTHQTRLSFHSYQLDPQSRYVNVFNRYGQFGGYKYEEQLGVALDERVSFSPFGWLSGTLGLGLTDLSALPKSVDLSKPYDPGRAAGAQGLFYNGSEVTDALGRNLAIPIDVFHVRNQNLGAYLEVKADPTRWLSLTGGGRFDYNTRYGRSVTPRIGAVFKPLDTARIKLLYGEAFLAPAVWEAYQHYGAFSPATDAGGNIVGLRSDFFRLPNPDLAPERLRMMELGLSWRPVTFLLMQADAYAGWAEDLIVDLKQTNQTFKGWPVDFTTTPTNSGRSTIWGGTLRMDGHWQPGPFALNPYVSWSLSRGTSEGRPIPVSAEHTIRGGLDFLYRDLSIALFLLSRTETLHPNVDNPDGTRAAVPGFTVVNLYARHPTLWRPRPFTLGAWLRVDNLLDNRFYHVTLASSVFQKAPQDPLRVLGGLELAF